MENPSISDPPISVKSAKFAVAFEKTVLPWLYAFLAWQRLANAMKAYHSLHIPSKHPSPLFRAQCCSTLAQNLLIFILIGLYGVMLLFSRRPTALPQTRKHILVPIAMSYYFVLYGILDYLPFSLRENLLPAEFQLPCSVAGVALCIAGYLIALWAIAYLRRSFSIFVSVREVVLKGPYSYVRHPIYLGYLLELCGIALAGFSVGIFFLAAGFVWLLVMRARMEEEKLCEASAAYRQYARRTGFLIPRARSFSPAVAG